MGDLVENEDREFTILEREISSESRSSDSLKAASSPVGLEDCDSSCVQI